MVGLATQLVQTWGLKVYRDVFALCWSIMTEIHMETHDEDYMRCCNGDCDMELVIMDQVMDQEDI